MSDDTEMPSIELDDLARRGHDTTAAEPAMTVERYAALREARTHCPHGHPASEYVRNSAGNYQCRTCKRESGRRRQPVGAR